MEKYLCCTGIKVKKLDQGKAGQGGEGAVYFGEWHGKPAAFKFLSLELIRKDIVKGPDGLRELLAESQRTMTEFLDHSKLKHENIVKVHFCYR